MKIPSKLAYSLALFAASTLGWHIANAENAPKKVLFFTKSSGFQHDMINRSGDQPSPAEKLMVELGKKNNLDITCSKDGSLFTTEYLAQFDAFCFYTTGDLTVKWGDTNPPMSKEGKAAFLDAIRGGKGFVGIHCATDTFDGDPKGTDPYTKMIGAEFIEHGAQQKGHQIVVDKTFPGISAVPDDFGPLEEWYTLRNFSPDLHVLLAQDTDSMHRQGPYNRPHYPSTWAQAYGKGRVFYTSMGHRMDVWTNPVFQQVLLGGLNWAVGTVKADVTPNIDKATPQANTLQPGK